ncbi:MAG: PQQ-binding-like beta-propeller repeat protein [Planctomycetales bacterium]
MKRRRLQIVLWIVASLTAMPWFSSDCSFQVAAQGSKGNPKKKSARPGTARDKGKSKLVAIDLGDASWPQFLGPRRDNIAEETGLLKKWPAAGPRLLTTLSGLGIGFSNVALADGTVYTLGSQGDRELVLALSLATGEQLWNCELAPTYQNGYGSGPRGTPTLDEDRLYALGATGELVCLERETGAGVWRKSLTREFGTKVPQWGLCESVLIDGDRLICTPGGSGATMVALDKRTGDLLWKREASGNDGPAYASAIAIESHGVRQYVNFTSAGVISLRAEDGLLLWRDDSSANGTANCCAPLFDDGMVFTASGYGAGGAMLALANNDDRTLARKRYQTNKMKVHHGGMILYEGHVYGADDAILTCLELKTGTVKWQNRSVGKCSLTCVQGLLIVRSEQGPVALVAASPAGYKELGRFSPPNRSQSSAWTYPVVCGGKLFLRDQDLLQVYDLKGR